VKKCFLLSDVGWTHCRSTRYCTAFGRRVPGALPCLALSCKQWLSHLGKTERFRAI